MSDTYLFKNIISSLEETEESFKDSAVTKSSRRVGISGMIAGGIIAIQAMLPDNNIYLQSIASIGMILSGITFLILFFRYVKQETSHDKGAPKKGSLLMTRAFYQTPKLTQHAEKLEQFGKHELEEFKDWLEQSIKQDAALIGIFLAIIAFLPKIVNYILSSVKLFGAEEYLSPDKHPYLVALFKSLPVSLAVIVSIFSVFLIFIYLKTPTHMRFAFYIDRAIKKKISVDK